MTCKDTYKVNHGELHINMHNEPQLQGHLPPKIGH